MNKDQVSKPKTEVRAVPNMKQSVLPPQIENAMLNHLAPVGQRARELRIIALLEAILAKLNG
jgi:hypothetical protein